MEHVSVLKDESILGLNLKPGYTFVDMTLGSGGHSKCVFESVKDLQIIGFDADGDAIKRAGKVLASIGAKPILINQNFSSLEKELEKRGISRVDAILFDLGISSVQLDDSGRGFTFRKDEPLLMTLTDDVVPETLTAENIVNNWDRETLETIIKGFGEEKYARSIARAITESRKIKPIKTTFELVEAIRSGVPTRYTHQKIHFATRTFQAIRIATNGELTELPKALEQSVNILNKGGRIAVITFHSLEDRIVKNFFKKEEADGRLKKITKKPIVPSMSETNNNPRSRSAKLRIVEKI
jgi:16S rRNA (cytosine1402-N4)-methyltransferase